MQKINFNINGKHYEATIAEIEHNVAEVELPLQHPPLLLLQPPLLLLVRLPLVQTLLLHRCLVA